MLTTEQIRNRTKTVTRRLGWKTLKPGDLLQGCVKCMGLKKGEKPEKLAVIRVVNVRREMLHDMLAIHNDHDPIGAYGNIECRKEGFPHMCPVNFVEFFCDHMGVQPSQVVTRIEFEYA